MEKSPKRKSKVKRVAIVTYNRIGDGQYDNGVIKRNGLEVYIAQNGHRSKWAAYGGSSEERRETRERMAEAVARQVNLEDMDHAYIYVGANGGEEAIRNTRNMSPEKITYVMCDCNYGRKKSMIRDYGNSRAGIIECECGGRETLDSILRKLIA